MDLIASVTLRPLPQSDSEGWHKAIDVCGRTSRGPTSRGPTCGLLEHWHQVATEPSSYVLSLMR